MDGPGTITWEEFLENAETFVRLSDEITDSWELRGEKSIPGQAYLYRQTKTFVSSRLADNLPVGIISDEWRKEREEEEEGEMESCDINDPYEANCETEQPFVTEHHILWSMSYGVPVLYFNGWFSDFPGVNQVSVPTARRLVHQDNLNYDQLSQAIHPILGTTFLQLHPCKSQELLSSMWKSDNKLVSWLSAVAPTAFNLEISLRYSKLTRSEKLKGTTSMMSDNEDI